MPASTCTATTTWKRLQPHLLPAGLYTALTLLITFPIILHLRTHIYGYPGDHSLWIWMTWWRKYSLLHDLPYRFVPLAQAPFGTDHAFRAYPGLLLTMAGLSIPFGEIATYNLMRLGAYVLSGFLTYLLTFRLTSNRAVSFIAGLLFAFSPYALEHAMHHVNVAQQWVLPLFGLALLNLRRKRSVGAAAWLGVAFAVGFYTENYYSYHTVVMAIVFALAETIAAGRTTGWKAAFEGRRLALYALAGLIGIGLTLPELIPVLREMSAGATTPLRTGNPLIRPDVWHFALSSRPWNFLLPSQESLFLGALSERAHDAIASIGRLNFAPPFLRERYGDLDTRWFWWYADDARSNELYLGYSVLAVAGYATWRWRRSRRQGENQAQGHERAFWVPFAIALFIVALLFSLPPYLPVGALLRKLWAPLHNLVIPMPSLLTMELAQPLRIARRFAAPMMLALAILTAWGLADLRALTRRPAARALLTLGFVALVFFEYARPIVITPMAAPQEYVWLAGQPEGSTAISYPFGGTQ